MPTHGNTLSESSWHTADGDDRSGRDTLWLVALSGTVVVLGMAYTQWWAAVVRHRPDYWIVPGDIWGTVRAAHWIAWGSPSYVYSARSALVTLPGFNALLAPVAALSSHLNLLEVAPGFPGPPKPTAWLLFGPIVLSCATLPLFAADAVLRLFGTTRWRRRLTTFLIAAAMWPALAIWGHGEDVLALGFVLYAAVMLVKGRLGAAGWLLGAALAMQLYAVALIPLFLFTVGWRKAPALLARSAVLPGFLFLAVVIPDPHATLRAILDQPNFPTVDHATPWVLVSPSLGRGTVAAGPGRLVGLVLAIAVGAMAVRFRTDSRSVLWLMAVVLGLRCVFESVMDPYYVMPIVVVALLAATRAHLLRYALVVAGGAGLTDLTYFRPEMWLYWGEMTAVIVIVLVAAWPGREARGRERRGQEPELKALGPSPAPTATPLPMPA